MRVMADHKANADVIKQACGTVASLAAGIGSDAIRDKLSNVGACKAIVRL